jgi:UrcA family protein
MRVMNWCLCALTLIGGLSACSPSGGVVIERASGGITFAASDLETEQGAKAVLDQMEADISELCRDQRSGQPQSDCVDSMLSSMVREVNSPNLTAAYQARKR